MSVEYYVDKFSALNMNKQNGHKSPHKVCLLLAVMELIQAGISTMSAAARRFDTRSKQEPKLKKMLSF